MFRAKLFVAAVGLIALTTVGCGNPAPSTGKSTPTKAASGGGADPASGSGAKGAAPADGSGAK